MVATSVAVGAQVGAGDPKGAKRAARLGVAAAFAAASTAAGGLLAARPLIAHLYSHDADVVELTSRCVPPLALLVFFDAQNVCIQGTLSGAGLCGNQTPSSRCNLISTQAPARPSG